MKTTMTESERAALQLAPGSRWDGGGCIVDGDGYSLGVESILVGGAPCLLQVQTERDSPALYILDVLAVIRAAGLDPVWTAARKLVDVPIETSCGFISCEPQNEYREALESLRKLVKP